MATKDSPSHLAKMASVDDNNDDSTNKNEQYDVTKTSIEVEIGEHEINDNDVLCGRGAGVNHRSGNRRFRSIIGHFQSDYKRAAKKGTKTNTSRAIVAAVRNANPPGRFLKKHPSKNIWYDIGDKKAWDKTSQTLRDLRDGVEETNQSSSEQNQQGHNKERKSMYNLGEIAHVQQHQLQTKNWLQEKDRQFQLMKLEKENVLLPTDQSASNPSQSNVLMPLECAQEPHVNAATMQFVRCPPQTMLSKKHKISSTPQINTIQPSNTTWLTRKEGANNSCQMVGTNSAPQVNVNARQDYSRAKIVYDSMFLLGKAVNVLDAEKQETMGTSVEVSDNLSLMKANINEPKNTSDNTMTAQPITRKKNHEKEVVILKDKKTGKRKKGEKILPTEEQPSKQPKIIHDDKHLPIFTQHNKRSINGQLCVVNPQGGSTVRSDDWDECSGVTLCHHKTSHGISDDEEFTSGIGMTASNSIDRTLEEQSKCNEARGISKVCRETQTISQDPITNSVGTQTCHQDLSNEPLGCQPSVKCMAISCSVGDIVKQSQFQELQNNLLKARKDSEVCTGEFSSDQVSLMQELRQWAYMPEHSTLEALKSHLFGYAFYSYQQRPSYMADLLDNICKKNKISELKAIHLAASKILSSSQIRDKNSTSTELCSISTNSNRGVSASFDDRLEK